MICMTPIQALKDNYIWMLENTNNQQVIIVDPGDAQPVLNTLAAKNLTLTAIWITHRHWDHTDGVAELIKHFAVPVYGSANEATPHCTHPLNDQDRIDFPHMDLSAKIIAIPGHTKGHIAYYANEQWLFSGDTLFTGGCGRIFEGTPQQMYNSLQKLAALPDQTQVYCGHEYTQANLKFAQTVEPDNTDLQKRITDTDQQRQQQLPTVPALMQLEKQTNPFLRCHIPAVQQAVQKKSGTTTTEVVDIFSTLRSWKNAF